MTTIVFVSEMGIVKFELKRDVIMHACTGYLEVSKHHCDGGERKDTHQEMNVKDTRELRDLNMHHTRRYAVLDPTEWIAASLQSVFVPTASNAIACECQKLFSVEIDEEGARDGMR